jgi:pimeloyl-ACP methyl ester carboxylesterase
MTISVREVHVGDLRFRCREIGAGGEPVVLLHGFPETSHMWTGIMPALAEAGYHCLAPDQRGYSASARPDAVDDYAYEHLAADIHAIAAAAGFDLFHLVGHDWGAIAAWAAVSVDPRPVTTFTSLSIPHYHAFAEAVWSDPEEEPYRGFLELFLAPDHQAEAVLSADDFAGFVSVWTASPPEQVAAYLEVFRQPGALTAALNWYRACRGHRRALSGEGVEFGPVATPTVLLWGRDDPYVRRRSVELAAPLMTGEYRMVEVDAGHWVVQEQPTLVLDELRAHLTRHPI